MAEVCGVATDDVIMGHIDKELGQARIDCLDEAMAEAGVPKDGSKDVTLASEMTALGCELRNEPPIAEPVIDKLSEPCLGGLGLITDPLASPLGLNAWLGLAQWCCLPQRLCFSVFDDAYDFVWLSPDNVRRSVGEACLSEVLTLIP